MAKKLGILPGCRLYLAGAPAGFVETLGAVKIEYAHALSGSVDIAHVFTGERAQLESVLRECRHLLDPRAIVWVSWPKKSAKIKTDVNEDTVRELALPLGFVDIKVCAIDPIWSGLKLVVRKKLR